MNCQVCKNNKLQFIYRFSDGPAMQNKLHDSFENALNEKKVTINLYGCKKCGLVFNTNFNPHVMEYSSNYDNTQDTSEYFNSYLKTLAERLNKRYNLSSKRVVEIGCGKGHFLKILYGLGVKNIKGFDPSYLDYDSLIDPLVIKQFFNKKNIKEKVDFIICRHVLEHIQSPWEFVSEIRECLSKQGVMYFEFPDLEWIIKNETFFDFFYEHCNYFTKKAVVCLFRQFGFKNILFNHGLDGQYFQLEISQDDLAGDKINFPIVDFDKISQFIDRKITAYKALIATFGNFVIWGAGAKGVTFLNRLSIDHKKCQYVIDINPNKQNKFIPITGQKIVSPEILKKEKVDNIIIMNPVYEKEVKAIALNYNYKGQFIIL
jgi:SAM-dependent methyltransferase